MIPDRLLAEDALLVEEEHGGQSGGGQAHDGDDSTDGVTGLGVVGVRIVGARGLVLSVVQNHVDVDVVIITLIQDVIDAVGLIVDSEVLNPVILGFVQLNLDTLAVLSAVVVLQQVVPDVVLVNNAVSGNAVGDVKGLVSGIQVVVHVNVQVDIVGELVVAAVAAGGTAGAVLSGHTDGHGLAGLDIVILAHILIAATDSSILELVGVLPVAVPLVGQNIADLGSAVLGGSEGAAEGFLSVVSSGADGNDVGNFLDGGFGIGLGALAGDVNSHTLAALNGAIQAAAQAVGGVVVLVSPSLVPVVVQDLLQLSGVTIQLNGFGIHMGGAAFLNSQGNILGSGSLATALTIVGHVDVSDELLSLAISASVVAARIQSTDGGADAGDGVALHALLRLGHHVGNLIIRDRRITAIVNLRDGLVVNHVFGFVLSELNICIVDALGLHVQVDLRAYSTVNGVVNADDTSANGISFNKLILRFPATEQVVQQVAGGLGFRATIAFNPGIGTDGLISAVLPNL